MSVNYSYFEFVRDWPEMLVAMNQLEIRLRSSGHTLAADRLLKAVGVLRVELTDLSVRAAAKATELLKESERRTRVRPDTQGAGGPRLGDSLVAEPIGGDLLPGSIGVNNEDLLDQNVPWWITNEEGSSANVGHTIFGTFTGGAGDAPPDPTLTRAHALFQPGRGPASGRGVIKNPIPERRFVLKAIPQINAMWQAEARAIHTRFDNELTAVLAMGRTVAR